MAKRIEIDSPATQPVEKNRRILVVDDNPSIHEDFRKILANSNAGNAELEQGETALFGAAAVADSGKHTYELAFAGSGEEALEKAAAAMQSGNEFALVFMDVRMAPGIDGVEATVRLLEMSKNLQVVICTAYSDYSWSEMHEQLGESDRVLILKKPFDNIEVLQCASALTEKWRLQKEASRAIEGLTTFIRKQMDADSSAGGEAG
jgi:CheY-like chemotaxis protein